MEPSHPRPNFFIVGAAKSGTTSLASYLGQHPEVFVSNPKEPNFFAFPLGEPPHCTGPGDPELMAQVLLRYTVTDAEEYAALFSGAVGMPAIGEASVRYLYEPDAAARLADYAPGARIIAVLRDPVDRMYSHYHMNVRFGFEPETFRRAVELEDERVEAGCGFDWRYRRLGCYAEQLERYFDCFGADRVLVLFHPELNAKPEEVAAKAFRHLGVDPGFVPDTEGRGMVGSAVRSPWLRRMFWGDSALKSLAKRLAPKPLRGWVSRRVERWNRGKIRRLSPAERRELSTLFLDADQRLTRMLGGPLPW